MPDMHAFTLYFSSQVFAVLVVLRILHFQHCSAIHNSLSWRRWGYQFGVNAYMTISDDAGGRMGSQLLLRCLLRMVSVYFPRFASRNRTFFLTAKNVHVNTNS